MGDAAIDTHTTELSSPPETARHSVQFHGNGADYFRIWSVNIVLTILTFGIYSAWAKVRTRRYFYNNTEIDGSTFDYHAPPRAILIGRIITFALFLAYSIVNGAFPMLGPLTLLAFGLVAPWILWRALRFNARMTSFRNVRFGFDGSQSHAYHAFFLMPLLTFITLYLAIPYTYKRGVEYIVNNTRYGQGHLKATLTSGGYLGLFVPLLIGGFVAVMGFVGLMIFLFPDTGSEPTPAEMQRLLTAILPAYVVLLLASVFFRAFFKAKSLNYLFNNLTLRENVHFNSTLEWFQLAKLYLTNTTMIIATLGLAYPWAAVRLARYRADHTEIVVKGELGEFISDVEGEDSAIGEELGEGFDIGFDFGL